MYALLVPCPLSAQEFSFYCPPRLRQARRCVSRRALSDKSALPEYDCQTPAAKRARLTHLATTRDVSRGAAPEDMVSPPPPMILIQSLIMIEKIGPLILCRTRKLIRCKQSHGVVLPAAGKAYQRDSMPSAGGG